MSTDTALLTFSIGPVHTFIAQARRVADLWTGSELLSHLIRAAVRRLRQQEGCSMVYPYLAAEEELPRGLPNRFLCRVPRTQAEDVAAALRQAVEEEWRALVQRTAGYLAAEPYSLAIDPRIWSPDGADSQTDHVLDIAWSWVPEDGSYGDAVGEGAASYDASRLYRPFRSRDEGGEKCAICGERTALPDGDRGQVRVFWDRVAESIRPPHDRDERYFRRDQTRLCLVCCTKRLFPLLEGWNVTFSAFDEFAPSDDRPYHALVAMDGDRLGEVLTRAAETFQGEALAEFHREVSSTLTRLAESLREPNSYQIALEALGADFNALRTRGRKTGSKAPQLIYAGGEDVLLICDARDAVTVARRLAERYRKAFAPLEKKLGTDPAHPRFTISAAILFAHSHDPAGLVFRDVETLLKEKAKNDAGRNALALRLAKRGGVPVEVAFQWDALIPATAEDEPLTWLEAFEELIRLVADETLSSGRIFNLREEELVLTEVLGDRLEDWQIWLRERLSRTGAPTATVERLVTLMAPFCQQEKTEALRIARFLGKEMGP